MHQIKCFVDLPKSQLVGDVLINFDFLQQARAWCYKLHTCCKGIHTVDYLSKAITFFKYFSTSQGTCERLLKPPKAVPFQTRPVTNWKGRVEISCPDAATPTITDVPQPCKLFERPQDVFYTQQFEPPVKKALTLWQHSRAALITETFPMHSKL